MEHVISEPCYKRVVLQRGYRKKTRFGSQLHDCVTSKTMFNISSVIKALPCAVGCIGKQSSAWRVRADVYGYIALYPHFISCSQIIWW